MSFDLATTWTKDRRIHAIRPEHDDLESSLSRVVPDGKRLSDVIASRPKRWKNRTAIRLGRRVAESLRLLHDRGKAHGDVSAKHIWCSPPAEFHLLWVPCGDMGASPTNTDDAPITLTRQSASVDFSDLGRLLYEVRYRKSLSREVGPLPKQLRQAVEKGPHSDPLDRILAYLLSSNPEAQFDSADQLAAAFEAAESLVQSVATEAVRASPAHASTPQASPPPASQATAPPAAASTGETTLPQPSDVPQGQTTGPPPQPVASTSPVEPAPQSEHATTPPHEPIPRRRRRRRSPVPVVAGMLAIPLLCLAIALVSRFGGPPESGPAVVQRRTLPSGKIPPVVRSATTVNSSATPSSGAKNGYGGRAADRRLWQPPQTDAGEDIDGAFSLSTLPPGPGIILHWKTAQWLADPTAQSLTQALSPELQSLLDRVSERAKVPLSDIDHATVSLHPGRAGSPEVTLTVETKEPVDRATWLKRAGLTASITPDGKTVYDDGRADGDVFFIEPGEASAFSRFAVGSSSQIRDIAEIDGTPIPLVRPLERLWKEVPDGQHLTSLITPNFLVTDSRAYLRKLIPRSESDLKEFLIPDVAAATVSLGYHDELAYFEARFLPSGGLNESELLARLRGRIEALPMVAEDFLINSTPDPSWKALAIRLPRMWEFATNNTRVDVDDRQVVVNAYLPAAAMPQLTLATVLAMGTPRSMAIADEMTTSKKALTLEEMLARPLTISMDQESLESAVALIAEEFGRDLPDGSTFPPVQIQGNDLRLLGITQNQQIRDFRFENEPLRSVLTKLLLAANPDRTASGPADPKQALVWVVAGDPPAILVTTRPVAAERYDLPAEFQASE